MQKAVRRYAEVRSEIRDADLLLFRPRGFLSRAIAVAGRSEYCHAAMAGWWYTRLMCVEMTSGGGRAQLLSNLVDQWPGVIDVYEVNPGGRVLFSKCLALDAMVTITGRPYGWWNLAQASLFHLPVLRFLVPPDEDDHRKSGWPPFCSQALSFAYRTGGLDPVSNLSDTITEPADLARSALFEYRFTLV